MNTFWNNLAKPFFVLAPMENVTDTVFRQIVANTAAPDVFFTEFTNTKGLLSEGNVTVGRRLIYTQKEMPLIVQIWGTEPETFYKASLLVSTLGFTGIDINMGCPDHNVVRKGGGSGLIKDQGRAKEIIQATIDGSNGLPVSVKTRIGFHQIQTEEWISMLLSLPIKALTVHGRTASEMSKVPAHWDEIKRAVEIRNEIAPHTIIIGNGDVESREDGIKRAQESGVDGLMIGRGIFKNIWVFEKEMKEHTLIENLDKLIEHTNLFEATWGDRKDFNILKKFYKMYVRDFHGAGELRVALMESKSYDEVRQIVSTYRNCFG